MEGAVFAELTNVSAQCILYMYGQIEIMNATHMENVYCILSYAMDNYLDRVKWLESYLCMYIVYYSMDIVFPSSPSSKTHNITSELKYWTA